MEPQNPEPVVPTPEPSVAVDPPAPEAAPVAPVEVKKGFPLIPVIALSVVLLAAIVFVVVKLVLPNLGGNTTSGTSGTITWWDLWEDQSVVQPLIDTYEKDHPNVKINFVGQSKEDYRERLTNALAKGTGPDIFSFHNTWVPMFKSYLDPMPASVMSAGDFSKNYYPVMTSDLSSGTSIVGIPLMYDGLNLFVNQDIFETQGKTVPTTWDELRQTAIELTIKDDNGVIKQAGVALGRTENVDHWPEILALMMLQNNVKLNNPTGPLAEAALQYFTVFSSQDGVWDATLPNSTQAFANGTVAMYFGPSWRAFEIAAINPKLRFKIVPVPQLPKQTPNEPNITYATYWAEGVNTKSASKAAAWDFLKYISSSDSLQKMYKNAAATRSFGEPYPRTDMASLLSTDSNANAVVSQAPYAQSWYLASRTFDGPTGINSQIDKYFEDAINAVNSGSAPKDVLPTVASGVNQVLSQYGLVTASTTTQTSP